MQLLAWEEQRVYAFEENIVIQRTKGLHSKITSPNGGWESADYLPPKTRRNQLDNYTENERGV
jgi:hypothetical protein